jgi:predicted Zn-dependent protease
MAGEESERSVDSLSFEVELLINHRGLSEGKKKAVTGSSKFTLNPSSLDRLETELELACSAALLVENEAYAMTEVSGVMPQVELSDPEIGPDAAAKLREAASRLRAAASKEAQVRFSSGELFADSTRLRYFNSQGVQAMQESSLFSGEWVLLARGEQGESEVFKSFKRRRLRDFDFETQVREAAEQARKRSAASLPKTGSFDVIFSGEALDHFFTWFSTQASASSRYNRVSSVELGQALAEPASGASPLTLWHNALIPYAVGSYRVDPSGATACRRLLIENGRLKSRWASPRYAQYLKQNPTGELGNTEVEPGEFSEAELFKPEAGRPLYHLFDFSYFGPNPVTGEFSAEIRTGEEISASGTRAVKGGSVSGLSSLAVSGARFSKPREQRELYFGPKWIRCSNLTLAGA